MTDYEDSYFSENEADPVVWILAVSYIGVFTITLVVGALLALWKAIKWMIR